MSKEDFYVIKGKILSGSATIEEATEFMGVVDKVFGMVEDASQEDFYGTEGYEHVLGWD